MRTNSPRVRLRWDEFDRLCTGRGWLTDAERAEKIGLARPTLANLRSLKFGPGAFVINQMLTVLEVPYADLFELETNPEQAVA